MKIREKPSGSRIWWVFVNHQGRRKAKKIGRDKRLAQEVARKIEARLALGEDLFGDDKPKVPTFGEYASVWLETQIKPFRRPTTYERYKDLLDRYILPEFGKKPLDRIRRNEVRGFLLGLLNTSGLAFKTVELIKDVISGPYSFAIDEDLIQHNPCAGVLKRVGHGQKKGARSFDVYSPDETALYLETARKREPDYYPLLLLLFRTGMRLGEAVGLKWTDVDWNGRFIMVRRSSRRQIVGETKTGRVRRVDMTDQLLGVIKSWEVMKKREALSSGRAMSDFIFSDRAGGPLSQNTLRNAFKRTARRAGLREIRVHDARHTYASHLLSAGAPVTYVKEQLGHSSITMTVDRYGHYIPTGHHVVNVLDTPKPATHTQPSKREGL